MNIGLAYDHDNLKPLPAALRQLCKSALQVSSSLIIQPPGPVLVLGLGLALTAKRQRNEHTLLLLSLVTVALQIPVLPATWSVTHASTLSPANNESAEHQDSLQHKWSAAPETTKRPLLTVRPTVLGLRAILPADSTASFFFGQVRSTLDAVAACLDRDLALNLPCYPPHYVD